MPCYKLTDSGKRLWRQQRAMEVLGPDGKYEHDEADFIRLYLIAPPGAQGKCWGCLQPRKLIRGAFCVSCIRGTVNDLESPPPIR